MFYNRSILIAAFVSLASFSAPAQLPVPSDATSDISALALTDWIRQSPVPTARNLTGATWPTATHGFVSGESLTLLETFDGGTTWQNVNLGRTGTDPLYNVYCVDASVCMAIGNSSSIRDIYRTSDGGATWQQLSNFVLGGSWYHIDFVSPTTGFMGSNGATARSTDAGATWQLMSGYPNCPVMFGMDFRDSLVGLCGGTKVGSSDDGPGIFKTSDAGATWVRKFSQSANDVLWLDNTTAIATVGTSIYRSTNSGDTWVLLSSQLFTGLDEMTLLPNGTIVGVSGLGDGWRSTDGGLNWTRTLVGPGSLPASWNVSFFDSLVGTIVGQGGSIFKTSDGGLTWSALNSGIGGVEFRDLAMFDDNTGIAVGDNGYFLRTTNGGTRWDVGRLQVTGVVLFRDENLHAINIVDQNFAVAAGNDGVVYKSFDRGLTWESIGYPRISGEVDLLDVDFITHDLGYATGTHPTIAQNVFKTTDGGATWTQLSLNAGGFVEFVDADHGWILNIGGLGYRTLNGGASWTQFVMPDQGFSPTISQFQFINQNVGWAVGWFGYAARTSNGGVSWTLQNIADQSEILLGLRVVSETEAYAVGIHQAPTTETASVYHTVNSGTTWTRELVPADYLNNVFASSTGNIWTSGFDGTVLHKAGTGGGSILQLLSAASRKTHRTAGTFDVALPLAGTPGIECRDGAGGYSLVFTFSNNVVSGSASVTSGIGTAGTPTLSGTTMTVPLSGVADVQTLTVTLTGVTDATSQVLPPTPLSASFLIGDVNADKTVNNTDSSVTQGQVGLAVSSSNFRDDVNISGGTITSADVKKVKRARGHTLP